jgi:GNAT superfamily N-acetyltransferase
MIKMGVDPKAQGKGIGMLLCKSIIAKAREMGGKKLVLYSNTKLKAALHIYEKLGFRSVIPEEGKYCRCDVKMEMDL